MVSCVECKAPAKVNLHLEIGGIRSDGFHDITSVFQKIDLYDLLRINLVKTSGCTIEGSFSFPVEHNLIYKAVRLFKETTGWDRGVCINVLKSIPVQGGLGGGSSDAASTLMGLNTLSGLNLDLDILAVMAEKLGSDVPFFLKGPAALVTGRGEFVKTISARSDFEIILVLPDFKVNTASAFRVLDERRKGTSFQRSIMNSETILNEYRKDPVRWRFFNSFITNNDNPLDCKLEIIRLLKEAGADYANMSGSGSSFFGVFGDREKAVIAKKTLNKRFNNVLKINPLARNPIAVVN